MFFNNNQTLNPIGKQQTASSESPILRTKLRPLTPLLQNKMTRMQSVDTANSHESSTDNKLNHLMKNANLKKLPKILNKLYNAVVNESESISFTIKVNGKDRPPPKWYFDETEININDDDFELSETDDEITLVIKHCKSENTGSYYLKFKNSFGEICSNKAKLIVNRLPKFIKVPKEDTFVQLNQSIKLEYTIDALPKAKVAWFLNNKELTIKDNFKFESDIRTGIYSLLIDKVTPVQIGTYCVKASNSIGSIEHEFQIEIFESPKAGIIEDSTTFEGDEHKISVELAAGKPKPKIEWFHNDSEIDITLNDLYDFIEIDKVYTLTIKAAKTADSGAYCAKLTNQVGSDISNKAQLIVKNKKHKISTIPASFIKCLESATYGSLSKSKEFPVQIISKPIARIKVYKNDKEIKSSSHLKFESEKLNENTIGFKLIIENIQASDTGHYKIEAINKYATVNTCTQFNVKGEPVFIRKPSDLTVTEKKQANFYCECLGSPMPIVEWFKDDFLLENTENIQIETKAKGLNSLLIKSVSLVDRGIYTVKARNETGHCESVFNLIVDVAPFFIRQLKEKVEALSGEEVWLETQIGGCPMPNIKWEKKGQEIKASKENGVEIISNGINNYLFLKSIQIEDAGFYTLIASNKQGKIQTKTELIVKSAPCFKRKLEDALVVEKRTSKLEVEIYSYPKANVTWFKNSVEIKDDERIQINDAKGGVYQLIIKNSNKDDTGTYKCQAKNQIGFVECSAELAIEKPPEFTKKLEKLMAAEQCEAEWFFQLVGLPKPHLEISRNNEIIDIDNLPDLYSIDELENKNYCLKFFSVSKKDVGTWKITATNQSGKAITLNKLESMPLTPPAFIRGLTNSRLAQDIDNKIEVLVNALPFPDFVWFKNGQKMNLDFLSRKYKIEIDKENGLIRLVLMKSSSEDSGAYKITLFNPGGECSSEGNYTIKGYPPKFEEKPESIKVLNGSQAIFAACINGDPSPCLIWSKGSTNLVESNKFDIFYDDSIDTHFLQILDCNSKDAGTYKVTASNMFGSENVSFVLNVTQNKNELSNEIDLKIKLKNRIPKVDNDDDDASNRNVHLLKKLSFKIKNEDKKILETPKLKHWENKFQKKFLKELTEPVEVPEHKAAIFECSISDANATVAWFFNHEAINNTMSKFKIYTQDDLRILHILDCLKLETNSLIVCKWDEIETSNRLFVTDCPFKISKGLENQKVLNNSTVILDCDINASYSLNYSFKWKKNGEIINLEAYKQKYDFKIDNNKYQLKINNFNSNDNGSYEIYLAYPTDFLISSKANIEIDPTIIPKRPNIKYDSKFNRDLIIIANENLNITCEISGVPKATIKWFKDFSEIFPSNKKSIRATFFNTDDYSQLIIDKIRIDESGEYTIRAENDFGKTDAKFTVKVMSVPDPIQLFKLEDVSTTSSKLIWLTPFSDGNTPILGFLIEKFDSYRDSFVRLGKTSLNEFLIERLEKGETHRFRIFAENKIGQSEPCELIKIVPNDIVKTTEVDEKPILVEHLKDLQVLNGNIAVFEAKIISKLPIETKWFFDDKPLRSLDAFPKSKNDIIELTLNNVQLVNDGFYKLIVKNLYGEVTSQAKLTVFKRPVIKNLSKYDHEILIFSQQTLNISCEIDGFPTPISKWYKGSKEINNLNQSRILIDCSDNIARLYIERIKRNEGGEYTLKVDNEVGKTEAKFVVKVVDVPDKPEEFTAENVSSTSSRLSWQSPKNDGNSTIIGYYIEKFDSKFETYVRLGKTSLNEFFVEKLEKGLIYKFRILAENKVGFSEPCELKVYMTEDEIKLPGAPDQPQITNITSTSCRVSWEAPKDCGGLPIKGYYIERKFASRWLRLNYKSPEIRKYLCVDDLIEGKEYEFRICAVNDLGEGAFSKNSDYFIAKNQFQRPEPPSVPEIRALSKTSCMLTWHPPEKTGGLEIFQYFIEMKKRNEQKFFKINDDFVNECYYQVTNLRENKEYQFRIIADNSIEKSEPSAPSRYFRVSGETMPQIEFKRNDFGCLVGDNGRIEAYVTGNPLPTIKWRKNSRLLSTNSIKYSISFNQPLCVLIIKNVTEEDADQYTIEADNIEGTVTHDIKFNIYGPPLMETDNRFKKVQNLSAGYNLYLACRVKGLPKPTIVWALDGTLITKNDKTNIKSVTDTDHCLEINDCNRYQSGFYICRATNEYGYSMVKFEVIVKDVPDPPWLLSVKLDSKARSAHLEWKPPTRLGGSELYGYNIEYARTENNTITTENLVWIKSGFSVSTKFLFENLIRNDYYYFRIFAENVQGISEPLVTLEPIQAKPATLNVPNAPEGPVEITNIKSTECTLSWFTPLDDGGDHIQSYVIDIKEKSKNKWIQLSIVDSHKLSTKALRLVEGNVYNFRIAAKNNVGLSEYLYSNDVVTSRPHTVPDSPNQLIVSDKQANSCALEWKTPIYNGGTELTGYLIDMKTNNEWTNIAKIKADLRYFQVLNLKENQEYYFRVSCLNKIGLSKPATMSTPVILKPKIATPLMPRSPLPKPKEIPPVIKTAPPTPKPAPKPVIKPIIPEKIEIKKPIEKTLGHPGRPEGPLIITNITDTTANYIQKTIAWKPPLHDGGSPITGYLIKRIDTKRPWEKRVSANTLTIKIKELVAHSDYLVQVFAENSQGLSSALESDEPIKARISDLYIIQEIHTNELIFKYKAENPDNTIWEVIYCKRSFGSRNITRSTDNTTIQRSNKKLKYIQSKLQLN